MQVVNESAEQFRHDHDVVLERGKPRDVGARRGFVACPHAETAVAGLPGRGGQRVAQIGDQSPVIRRVRQPLPDEVMAGRGSQRVHINEERRPIGPRRSATSHEGNTPPVEVGRTGARYVTSLMVFA